MLEAMIRCVLFEMSALNGINEVYDYERKLTIARISPRGRGITG